MRFLPDIVQKAGKDADGLPVGRERQVSDSAFESPRSKLLEEERPQGRKSLNVNLSSKEAVAPRSRTSAVPLIPTPLSPARKLDPIALLPNGVTNGSSNSSSELGSFRSAGSGGGAPTSRASSIHIPAPQQPLNSSSSKKESSSTSNATLKKLRDAVLKPPPWLAKLSSKLLPGANTGAAAQPMFASTSLPNGSSSPLGSPGKAVTGLPIKDGVTLTRKSVSSVDGMASPHARLLGVAADGPHSLPAMGELRASLPNHHLPPMSASDCGGFQQPNSAPSSNSRLLNGTGGLQPGRSAPGAGAGSVTSRGPASEGGSMCLDGQGSGSSSGALGGAYSLPLPAPKGAHPFVDLMLHKARQGILNSSDDPCHGVSSSPNSMTFGHGSITSRLAASSSSPGLGMGAMPSNRSRRHGPSNSRGDNLGGLAMTLLQVGDAQGEGEHHGTMLLTPRLLTPTTANLLGEGGDGFGDGAHHHDDADLSVGGQSTLSHGGGGSPHPGPHPPLQARNAPHHGNSSHSPHRHRSPKPGGHMPSDTGGMADGGNGRPASHLAHLSHHGTASDVGGSSIRSRLSLDAGPNTGATAAGPHSGTGGTGLKQAGGGAAQAAHSDAPSGSEHRMSHQGVSVAYLVKLLGSLPAGEDAFTTQEVVQQWVVPHTAPTHCRLIDLVPAIHCGQPRYYICHAWKGLFATLVEQLRRHCWEQSHDPAHTFVWIDFVCCNQHTKQLISRDVSHVRDIINSCRQVLLVVDHEGYCFRRLWCLYEMYVASMGAQGLEHITLIGHSTDGSVLCDLLRSVSLSKAEVSKAEDRQLLIDDIDNSLVADAPFAHMTPLTGIAAPPVIHADLGQVSQEVVQYLIDAIRHEASSSERSKTNNPKRYLAALQKQSLILLLCGQYWEAEKLLRQLLLVNNERNLLQAAELLAATNRLALMMKMEGYYDEAERLCNEALEMATTSPGLLNSTPHVLMYLSGLTSLADVLLKKGDMDGAEKVCKKAIQARGMAAKGAADRKMVVLLRMLADIAVQRQQMDKAHKYLGQALAVAQTSLGRHSLDVATVHMDLAQLAYKRQQQEQAAAAAAEKARLEALQQQEQQQTDSGGSSAHGSLKPSNENGQTSRHPSPAPGHGPASGSATRFSSGQVGSLDPAKPSTTSEASATAMKSPSPPPGEQQPDQQHHHHHHRHRHHHRHHHSTPEEAGHQPQPQQAQQSSAPQQQQQQQQPHTPQHPQPHPVPTPADHAPHPHSATGSHAHHPHSATGAHAHHPHDHAAAAPADPHSHDPHSHDPHSHNPHSPEEASDGCQPPPPSHMESAMRHVTAAISIRQLALGPDHPLTVEAQCLKAGLLTSQRKFEAAQALLEAQMVVCQAWGAHHAATLACTQELGHLRDVCLAEGVDRSESRPVEAEALLQRALEITRGSGQWREEEERVVLRELVEVYRRLGRQSELRESSQRLQELTMGKHNAGM